LHDLRVTGLMSYNKGWRKAIIFVECTASSTITHARHWCISYQFKHRRPNHIHVTVIKKWLILAEAILGERGGCKVLHTHNTEDYIGCYQRGMLGLRCWTHTDTNTWKEWSTYSPAESSIFKQGEIFYWYLWINLLHVIKIKIHITPITSCVITDLFQNKFQNGYTYT